PSVVPARPCGEDAYARPRDRVHDLAGLEREVREGGAVVVALDVVAVGGGPGGAGRAVGVRNRGDGQRLREVRGRGRREVDPNPVLVAVAGRDDGSDAGR